MSTHNKKRIDKSVWVGLLHVRPSDGNTSLNGAMGAYVQTLAMASDANDYTEKVVTFSETCDFRIIEIMDVEPLTELRNRSNADADLIALGDSMSHGAAVTFYVFNTYDRDPDTN